MFTFDKHSFKFLDTYKNYNVDLPLIKESKNNTKKIKNKILAIPAAPAASPPNPSIAAIIAITRKVIVQRNIIKIFWVKQYIYNTLRFRKRAKTC